MSGLVYRGHVRKTTLRPSTIFWQEKPEGLTTTAPELKSRIGRPYVVLRFLPLPPPPKPRYDAETNAIISDFRASEFIVLNPSDQDAFEIRVPFTELGNCGCAIYSWKTLDL
jgi:hypothetical protein